MSLNLLSFADMSFIREKNNIEILHTLRDIYVNAKENNLEEIVLTRNDIKRLGIERFFEINNMIENPSNYNNSAFSQLMKRYYIDKYIPIIIIDE